MPITDGEWDQGRLDPGRDGPRTAPVGEHDTERALVLAFLDENADRAFTAREILRGVDFDERADPDTVTSAVARVSPRATILGRAGDAVVDEVGDLVASGMVLGDVETVLGDLVEEGTVVAKEIDADDGSETYYRLNTGNEQVEG